MAVVIALIWACRQRDPTVRALVVAAVAFGVILTLGAVLISGQVALPSARPDLYVRGSRYAQPAVLLLISAAIVAVDGFLRRTGIRHERAAHATAAVLLVAVLGTTWAADFRYVNSRATYQPGRCTWPGSPTAARNPPGCVLQAESRAPRC